VKKIICCFIFLFLFSNHSFSQPPQQWIANYNGTANQLDYGRAIQIDNKGNVFIAGTATNNGTTKDIVVVKYSSQGIEQWVGSYNGTADLDDWAYGLVIDAEGNAYATGFTTTDSSGKDFVTVKFDSSGNFEWAKQYNGSANLDDMAAHIAIDLWGNVAITGISKGLGTGGDYATIKYDSQGNELWVMRYDGPASGIDDARTIAADQWGNFYVSGGSTGDSSDYDFATTKYDSLGNEKWVMRYNGSGNDYDLVYYQGSLVVDSSGNVYVTGYSTGLDSTLDYATIKYDSSGNEQWVKRFFSEPGKTEYADAIAIDDSLNVYVTGASFISGQDFDFATVKYDRDGNQKWVSYYNGTGNAWDEAYGIVTDDSFNIFIVGRSLDSTESADFVTIKYLPNGIQDWEIRYNHHNYDWPFNIRLSDDNNIYVGGFTATPGGLTDFAVIKYGYFPVGINDPDGTNEFEISPNPTDNFLIVKNILLQNEPFTICVFELSGRVVLIRDVLENEESLKLDCSSLQSGIYFLQINSAENIQTLKFVKM